jgi:hypothetical protein
MYHPILTAAFVAALISSWDVHSVMALDPCGEPCLQAGATVVVAAAATSPPSWMEISDQPEAGKFFQVRPEKGFRAVTSIAKKAGISWRWIEASEWNRNRYFDPRISDNLRPNGGITLTRSFAPFGSKTKPLAQRTGTGSSFPVLWLPKFAGDEPSTTPVVEPGDEPSKDKPLRNRLTHLCVSNRVLLGSRRAKRLETVLRGDEISIWIGAEGGCESSLNVHQSDLRVFWSIGGATFRKTDLCRELPGGSQGKLDCDLPKLPSMELEVDFAELAFPERISLSISDEGRSAVGVAASSAIDADGRLVDPVSVDLQIRDPFAPRAQTDVLQDWTGTATRSSDRGRIIRSLCAAFKKVSRRKAVEVLIPAFLGRSKAFRNDLKKRFSGQCKRDGIASAIRKETRFLSGADKRETQEALFKLIDTGTLDRYDELVLSDFPKGHATADAERFRSMFAGYRLTCVGAGINAEVGQAVSEALLTEQRAREKMLSDRGRDTGTLQRKEVRKAFEEIFLAGLKSGVPPAKKAKALAILLRNLTATRNKILWGQLEFACRRRDPHCGGNTFAHTRSGQNKIFLCSKAVTSFGQIDKRKDQLVNMVLHEAAHTVGVVPHGADEFYVDDVVEWQSLPLFDERKPAGKKPAARFRSGRLSMADGTSRFSIRTAEE